MNSIIIIILLFAFTLPCQAVQKCTDANGRITYADFCPALEPVKVESLYIPDTYDADADRQAQENIRGMEESTRQSIYERQQRYGGNRQRKSVSSTYNDQSVRASEANKHFDEANKILKNMPYGNPGDRAKRQSMIDQARILQNMGRAKMGQNTVPGPREEYWDGKTNKYYEKVPGGIRDKETGRVSEEFGGKYRDPLTGEFVDPMRTR